MGITGTYWEKCDLVKIALASAPVICSFWGNRWDMHAHPKSLVDKYASWKLTPQQKCDFAWEQMLFIIYTSKTLQLKWGKLQQFVLS